MFPDFHVRLNLRFRDGFFLDEAGGGEVFDGGISASQIKRRAHVVFSEEQLLGRSIALRLDGKSADASQSTRRPRRRGKRMAAGRDGIGSWHLAAR
jgi:hypothetical protein